MEYNESKKDDRKEQESESETETNNNEKDRVSNSMENILDKTIKVKVTTSFDQLK